ncbi:unnamed protein product [Amoebophrya sp. A120]|nr:unnamed protein product [Amoebophrya sp. A120]|eukprot:GSA120T00000014001.1
MMMVKPINLLFARDANYLVFVFLVKFRLYRKSRTTRNHPCRAWDVGTVVTTNSSRFQKCYGAVDVVEKT